MSPLQRNRTIRFEIPVTTGVASKMHFPGAKSEKPRSAASSTGTSRTSKGAVEGEHHDGDVQPGLDCQLGRMRSYMFNCHQRSEK